MDITRSTIYILLPLAGAGAGAGKPGVVQAFLPTKPLMKRSETLAYETPRPDTAER